MKEVSRQSQSGFFKLKPMDSRGVLKQRTAFLVRKPTQLMQGLPTEQISASVHTDSHLNTVLEEGRDKLARLNADAKLEEDGKEG
jgi:hypothetical protein